MARVRRKKTTEKYQRTYTVTELSQKTGTPKRTLYRRINAAVGTFGNGIVIIKDTRYLAIKTKTEVLLQDDLFYILSGLQNHICGDCGKVLQELINRCS
jgi:hypothetical protein